MSALRVAIADDERPARSYLAALLRACEEVTLVGEAQNGPDAVALIDREKPDLALLDLQMPEMDGLQVVRALKKPIPLVAFVTAFDQYAVKAFEISAVDYLLKPVEEARLRETLNRARDRVEHNELIEDQIRRIGSAADTLEAMTQTAMLERIPVRKRDEVLLVAVSQLASIVAEGELLYLTTLKNERHTITYRLKDLELRLDPARFIRLGRGTLVNVDAIVKVNVMPGGTHIALLANGQKLPISRIQSRLLRDRLFKL